MLRNITADTGRFIHHGRAGIGKVEEVDVHPVVEVASQGTHKGRVGQLRPCTRSEVGSERVKSSHLQMVNVNNNVQRYTQSTAAIIPRKRRHGSYDTITRFP